jgi:hypothetical protein
MVQESVLCTYALHGETLLRRSAVVVDPTPCPTSTYYHKKPKISFLPHLVILQLSLLPFECTVDLFGQIEVDIGFELRC